MVYSTWYMGACKSQGHKSRALIIRTPTKRTPNSWKQPSSSDKNQLETSLISSTPYKDHIEPNKIKLLTAIQKTALLTVAMNKRVSKNQGPLYRRKTVGPVLQGQIPRGPTEFTETAKS